VAGFVILTAILFGLTTYIGSHLFFLFSRSWIAPAVVAPTDERVLKLKTELAERHSERDRVLAERLLLQAQLDDARRTASMLDDFQNAFKRALEADLHGRKQELAVLESLQGRYRKARAEIEHSNEAFAGMSRERLGEEHKAGLIEKDQFLTGNYHIAQIANANLSLAEKEAQLAANTARLRRETEAYASALPKGWAASSYDTLRMKEDLRRAILDGQRARDLTGAYEKRMIALDGVLRRYDDLVREITESPLMLATDKNFQLAFVPYDNVSGVKPNAPIYACRMRMFFCREVGRVVTLLGAEVVNKHPYKNDLLRGQMVHISLREPGAGKQSLLYVGGAPLLF
jgi:hypothetical protein